MPKLVLLVVLAVLTGCWPDDNPPGLTPCVCNNNGRCETESEDCSCCPKDCPCCRAILAVGTDVQDPENVTGDGDSTFAKLGAASTLTLTVGSQITGAGTSAGGDFLLVGQVTSDSTVTVAETCAVSSASGDGYQVEVSFDGTNWDLVGFWTRSTSPPVSGQGQPFSLGCASAKPNQARHVRLSPIGNSPAAQLDALVVSSCGLPQ